MSVAYEEPPVYEQWEEGAACHDADPEQFFDSALEEQESKPVREARVIGKYCLGCDVRSECLATALDADIEFGVWGGVGERGRRAIARGKQTVAVAIEKADKAAAAQLKRDELQAKRRERHLSSVSNDDGRKTRSQRLEAERNAVLDAIEPVQVDGSNISEKLLSLLSRQPHGVFKPVTPYFTHEIGRLIGAEVPALRKAMSDVTRAGIINKQRDEEGKLVALELCETA